MVTYRHEQGRRVAKLVNGELAEAFVWDGPRLVEWFDARDGMHVVFEYASDARLPMSMVDASGRYFLAYDQVGSLKAIASTTGNMVKVIAYDTFGNVVEESAPQFAVPFGFAGGLRDVDTGLTRFGVRDYDPLFGRFTARDPLGEAAGDADVYGYCLDDPVNGIDPTGLFGIFEGLGNMFEGIADGLGGMADGLGGLVDGEFGKGLGDLTKGVQGTWGAINSAGKGIKDSILGILPDEAQGVAGSVTDSLINSGFDFLTKKLDKETGVQGLGGLIQGGLNGNLQLPNPGKPGGPTGIKVDGFPHGSQHDTLPWPTTSGPYVPPREDQKLPGGILGTPSKGRVQKFPHIDDGHWLLDPELQKPASKEVPFGMMDLLMPQQGQGKAAPAAGQLMLKAAAQQPAKGAGSDDSTSAPGNTGATKVPASAPSQGPKPQPAQKEKPGRLDRLASGIIRAGETLNKFPAEFAEVLDETAGKMTDPKMVAAYKKIGVGLVAGNAFPLALAGVVMSTPTALAGGKAAAGAIMAGGRSAALAVSNWVLANPEKAKAIADNAGELLPGTSPSTPAGWASTIYDEFKHWMK